MIIIETNVPDVRIFRPDLLGDDRGHFMETFRASSFKKLGLDGEFVQDNQSRSVKGTLRGLHFQHQFPQGKLVRVIAGEVFDVAVDLRKSSTSFGQWVGATLSSDNRQQLWVPPGFAHGFYVLSEWADLCYKCTDYYHPEDDHTLVWNDPDVAIDWPLLSSKPLLSEKDASGRRLDEIPLYS